MQTNGENCEVDAIKTQAEFNITEVRYTFYLSLVINPLTAGAADIRVFISYQHIKYHILNMLKIKGGINQQDLKRVDFHFVKCE